MVDNTTMIIWNLLAASQGGNYLQAFDYAVTLAHISQSATAINRLDDLRKGVEIKKGVRVPFSYLIHQYGRMRDDNLKRKVRLITGGKNKVKATAGEILEGIRLVNRIVLITCFEVMEEKKISINIAELYKENPNRDSI